MQFDGDPARTLKITSFALGFLAANLDGAVEDWPYGDPPPTGADLRQMLARIDRMFENQLFFGP